MRLRFRIMAALLCATSVSPLLAGDDPLTLFATHFGDDVTKALGDGPEITFPLWCRITVKRLVSGREVSFTAKEYWLENYATKSSKSAEPNAMWKKRPYAQLAKCAEAQALRKAFPEVGAQATADELEGQQIVEHDITPPARHVAMPRAKAAPVSDAQLVDADPASAPEAPINTAGLASKGEKAFLVRRAGDKNIDLKEVCAASGITDFENLTTDGFQVLKEALK